MQLQDMGEEKGTFLESSLPPRGDWTLVCGSGVPGILPSAAHAET